MSTLTPGEESQVIPMENILNKNIKKLVQYGINSSLIPESEKNYSINLLLDVFGQSDYCDSDISDEELVLEDILHVLTDEACKLGIIEDNLIYRDLFDTRLMNCITPRPSQVIDAFWEKYSASPKTATDYYFQFSQDTNYIRRARIARDIKWVVPSRYGDIDITINLSKPEKDPKAIALAKSAPVSSYPKCLLCMENEGYAGNVHHPARQNHRIIPLNICGEQWGLQYSPYVYYNEHCIVFNGQHTPMKIEKATFEKLFAFVKLFPHYFIGSNADLPIVGGSILSHDHFQGGNYTFPMARANTIADFHIKGFDHVDCGILNWPLSVIRLKSKKSEDMIALADYILESWRHYTDESAFIFAETDGEPHNTITPIARFRDGLFELDLALRNNITTKEHPLGVYHPHSNLHHIKKENIGLIEVLGLAILPSRLKSEMELLAEYILSGKNIRENETLVKHADWVDQFSMNYSSINADNIMDILHDEIGKVFVQVLEDAGVYKSTPEGLKAFLRFIDTL